MGKLSYKARKKMPKSSFALPGKIKKGKRGGKNTRGAYPISDPAHARAALRYGARFASPGQLATIKRKVKARYPGIAVGGKRTKKKK